MKRLTGLLAIAALTLGTFPLTTSAQRNGWGYCGGNGTQQRIRARDGSCQNPDCPRAPDQVKDQDKDQQQDQDKDQQQDQDMQKDQDPQKDQKRNQDQAGR